MILNFLSAANDSPLLQLLLVHICVVEIEVAISAAAASQFSRSVEVTDSRSVKKNIKFNEH